MVVHKRYIGTQTRPDSAPNGILHQEDCFATCCAGSDVAHFSPQFGRSCHKLWQQFACASVVRDWIRRWLCTNVTLGHKQDLTVHPTTTPTESYTRKTVSQRAALAPTLLIFRQFGRSCHKLWRQFACASVVRDWIRRWLFANVTLGHKQDLTVPPTEYYTRKTVSQRAALASTLLIFCQFLAARVTNSGSDSRVQVP